MKVAFFNYLPLAHGGGLAQFYNRVTEGLHDRYSDITAESITLDESSARRLQTLYSFYFLRNEHTTHAHPPSHPTASSITDLATQLATYDLIYTKNDILDLTLLKMARAFTTLPRIIIGFHTPIHYHRTPTIQSYLHNALYGSLYYRHLLKMADGYHVLNEYHELELHRLYPHTPILKVHNPGGDIHVPVGRRRVRTSVIWSGRLNRDKGCDDLLRLIKDIRHPHIQWHIVGDGPMRSVLERCAAINPHVHVYGTLTPAQLRKLYQSAHIFVSTSRFECLPYSLIEAQSAGLYALAYNIPGCRDIITSKTGFLAPTYHHLKFALAQAARRTSQINHNQIASLTRRRFESAKSIRMLHNFFLKIYVRPLR